MSQISFEEFQQNLNQADRRLLRELRRELTIAGLNMERRSKNKEFSRFNNQTGRLRASIGSTFRARSGRPTVELTAGSSFGGADVDYAEYIEFGTSRITPRLFLGRSVDQERRALTPRLANLMAVVLNVTRNTGSSNA
jgi:hypothetical protein